MNFYGKYRGTVIDNVDPEGRGRVRAQVPAVQGEKPTTWAEACLPLSGTSTPGMGVFCVPPVGAPIWVEFEGGNPNLPIWAGGRFSAQSEVPKRALGPGAPDSRFVIQTKGDNSIVLSDVPGEGITLRSSSGAEITINQSGIKISVPGGASIELKGATVNINGEALEVT